MHPITTPLAAPRRLLAAAMLAMAAAPAALAQPPAAGPQSVQPIAQPQQLVLRPSKFRFAAEAANLGVPLRNSPARILAEGSGLVAPDPRSTDWILNFERLYVDGAPYAANPLARALVQINPAAPNLRKFDIDYRGIQASPQAAANPYAFVFLRRIVDTTIYALFLPPPTPVVDRTPVVDVNPALYRHIAQAVPGAQIVQPATPAVATGLLDYRERRALMVRQSGPFTVRAYNANVTFQSDAVGIVDLLTAIPLFMRAQVAGDVPLPFVNGRIDYLLRVSVSLDDQANPLDALQPLTPLPGQGPPPSAVAPMPMPAVAPPPMPVPAAAPPASPPRAAPSPAPAAASPPAGVSPATQQRLQTLKSLYDQGLITREQYEQRQRELLANP
jgi:hypothetical protein